MTNINISVVLPYYAQLILSQIGQGMSGWGKIHVEQHVANKL